MAEQDIDDDLEKLKQVLDKHVKDSKQLGGEIEEKSSKLLKWLRTKISLIEAENSYDPKEDNSYKRKQIVHVDFGFNIGNEFGGPHFAIVLWSQQTSGTITVVPLFSDKNKTKPEAKPGETKENNFYLHVNLGQLLEDGIINIAKIEQIRAVSKLRVNLLAKGKYKTYALHDQDMNRIDDAVRLYTFRGELLNSFNAELTKYNNKMREINNKKNKL